jgi:hypothetical protein
MFKKRKEEQQRIEAKIQNDRFYRHSVETIEKYGEALKQLIEVVNSDNIFESIKTFNIPFPGQASLKVLIGNVELEFNKAVEGSGWQLYGRPSESILNDSHKKSIYLARFGMKIEEIGHFSSLNKSSEFLVKYLSDVLTEYSRMVLDINRHSSVNEMHPYTVFGDGIQFNSLEVNQGSIAEVLEKMLRSNKLNVLSGKIENLAIVKILEKKGL